MSGQQPPTTQCAPAANYPAATTPVAFWSTEARCAIVPAGPAGIFGAENFGNKFPGEAAVYMGIVHVALYDAALAIEGGYKPYAIAPTAPPGTSPEAAIATAAYDTLVGLQPALGLNPSQQAILDGDYAAYLGLDPTTAPRRRTGSTSASRSRRRCSPSAPTTAGRSNPTVADLDPPAAGPGVWQPAPGPVLGLRLPGIKPLALTSASQFRPDGPNSLTSQEYADDFNQVKELGRIDSTSQNARADELRRDSGPTTTSGSGTTACSALPPPGDSTSCRPLGCWRWHTSPAATR